MSVMKASELVRRHIDVAKNYKTVYMWGCFGSPVTNGIITEKANQYPDWYGAAKQASLRGLIGKGYFGFDCVNLTKGSGRATRTPTTAARATPGTPSRTSPPTA